MSKYQVCRFGSQGRLVAIIKNGLGTREPLGKGHDVLCAGECRDVLTSSVAVGRL